MNKVDYRYRGKVVNVVDGDTVDINVELGFNIVHLCRFRLAGIDTSEKTSKIEEERASAIEATSALTNLILNQTVFIESQKADKYGRYLATVYLPGIDQSINRQLLDSRLAKEYYGGKKQK